MERVSYRSKRSESTDQAKVSTEKKSRIQQSHQPQFQIQTLIQFKPKFDTTVFTQSELVVNHKLKTENLEYQNLLIEEEELNLISIEHKILYKELINTLKDIYQPLTRLQEQISKVKASLKLKVTHINKYYEYLYKKLLISDNNYFGDQDNSKQKEEKQYQIISINQEKQLKQLQKERSQLKMDLDICQKKKKNLHYQVHTIQQRTMSTNNFEASQINKSRNQEMIRLGKNSLRLLQEKESLARSQRQSRLLNQNLKYLLTVEQEHRNSCMIIQSAFIKKQTQKVINYVYQIGTYKENEEMIPDAINLIRQRKQKCEELSKEILDLERVICERNEQLQRKICQFSDVSEGY